VFIFATSEAKSDASSESLIFLFVHEIWVLGLWHKRVVDGKGLGCNFWDCGVIIEEKKGILKAIQILMLKQSSVLIIEGFKGFVCLVGGAFLLLEYFNHNIPYACFAPLILRK
jgi:hypothetical protein